MPATPQQPEMTVKAVVLGLFLALLLLAPGPSILLESVQKLGFR